MAGNMKHLEFCRSNHRISFSWDDFPHPVRGIEKRFFDVKADYKITQHHYVSKEYAKKELYLRQKYVSSVLAKNPNLHQSK